MIRTVYSGKNTQEISFPLGGIGTGCIGLGGNGQLKDWEIFNRPNKGSLNGFTHFAVKAESQGCLLDARVLNGDLQPPYAGSLDGQEYHSFGFGPARATMAGVPHFIKTVFKGEFPLAEIKFSHPDFPGNIKLKAFNPFIPLNDKDSGIPAAFFTLDLKNTTDDPIDYTICLSVNNPMPFGTAVNQYFEQKQLKGLHLASNAYPSDAPQFGDLTVATDHDTISFQEYWYRGSWFDNLEIFWREFCQPGSLNNRNYGQAALRESHGQQMGGDMASLAAHVKIPAGQRAQIRFVLAWSFPNFEHYWQKKDDCACKGDCDDQPKTWQNYYAAIFKSSKESACYALDHWERLFQETRKFKDILYRSSIPEVALEAISSNLSILKTPTCIRLEDGSFYGWEGCHPKSGCCEGSCTHVWNYAYSLPFLFPKLERSMRDLDFKYNLKESGAMPFRLQLPPGSDPSEFRACADGQFGGVIKVYRDWKISGDNDWLRQLWPAIKKCIAFAWSPDNADRWDPEKRGVLTGRQHHTLDMELFGPNAWLTGFYLAALKAAAEMAGSLDDPSAKTEYSNLFEKGRKWADLHLFNGEYYQQLVELKDKSLLDVYPDAVADYWNNESHELKYQIGEGCEIDQLIGQWHAHLVGLGDIFDRTQRHKAAQSMFRHLFKPVMRDCFNPCRLYCLNDEAGMVIADWPEGKYKPVVPLPYSGETQNGYEYQAAILMIQEGLVEEGLTVVKAIRDRYDGHKRNPWNEFECGSNYARSMASYALLLAFSGFEYDLAQGLIGFHPIPIPADSVLGKIRSTGKKSRILFQTFWSLDSGWGSIRQENDQIILELVQGCLDIKTFCSSLLSGKTVRQVTNGQVLVSFTQEKERLLLAEPVELDSAHQLTIAF